MSLKSVHVLFIVLATTLVIMFGVWSLRNGSISAAIVSFFIGAGLLGYGMWFVSKTKGMRSE